MQIQKYGDKDKDNSIDFVEVLGTSALIFLTLRIDFLTMALLLMALLLMALLLMALLLPLYLLLHLHLRYLCTANQIKVHSFHSNAPLPH